jgi:hypothetical protein
MSPEYRISSLESDVRRCKSEIEALKDYCRSEIKAVEDRARERRDYWLSATFWTLCGLGAFGYLLLILETILKAHSN